MRVTQKSLTRMYQNGLNRNLKNLTDSNLRLNSGRSFSKVSENITDAQRAFKIRDQLRQQQQMVTNIGNLQSEFSTQEQSLMQINEILNDVHILITKGATDTSSPQDRKIIANELSNLGKSIMQIINSKSADRYTFSAHQNQPPVKVDEHGKYLIYNVDAETADRSGFLDGKVLVDVGLSLRLKSNEVDPSSALTMTTSAVDVLGYGFNEAGIERNILSLIQRASSDLNQDDPSDLSKIQAQLSKSSANLLVQLTEVGTRIKYLDQTQSRIEAELLSLTEMQNNIESIDFEKEVIQNKSFEMAWQISLQLGSKILPVSIFDFMR